MVYEKGFHSYVLTLTCSALVDNAEKKQKKETRNADLQEKEKTNKYFSVNIG